MPHLYLALVVSTWHRLRHLGGVGLILLGVADNSAIPLPGSMDVLTIWLAASNRHLWLYYAAMALVGSVIGGYITYMLARKGGKPALERKISKQRAETIYKKFERRGFWAVAVPALLPPPFPIVPFLVAAGAMQYSRKKFLAALSLGRGIRFTVVAGLGALYGRHIISFFSRYYQPALITLVALAVLGGLLALVKYMKYRRGENATRRGMAQHKAA